MSQYEVDFSQVIPAPPDVVYGVLRDYHHGLAAILPKPYFTEMTVEKGGVGAGRVTIRTQTRTSPGLRGLLEKWMTPAITRQIYREELALLADYVQHEPGLAQGK